MWKTWAILRLKDSRETIKGVRIYISEKDNIDIAFIETEGIVNPFIYGDEGKVMQE